MARRIIGQFIPSGRNGLPNSFGGFQIPNNDGHSERLGILEGELSPSDIATYKSQAAAGNLGSWLEVAAKVETDSRVAGLMKQLVTAISSLPIKVEPADALSDSEKRLAADYAEVVSENFKSLDLRNLIKEFIRVTYYGYRVFNLSWKVKPYPFGKKIVMVDKIVPIALSRYRMERQQGHERYGELRIVTFDNHEGYFVDELDDRRILFMQEGCETGKYDMLGLARVVVPWWITKVFAQLLWAEFMETYGKPIRIGTYSSGAGEAAKMKAESFLRQLGSSGYALIPDSMSVQLLQTVQNGNIQVHSDLIKLANEELAMAIVGQLDTVGSGSQGSRARATVLDGVRYSIAKDSAMVGERGMTELGKRIIRMNYGDDYQERLCPTVKIGLQSPHALEEKSRVFIAASGVIPIPSDFMAEELGIPRPRPGQEVVYKNTLLEYIDGKSLSAVSDPRESDASGGSRDGEEDGGDNPDEDS